LVWNSDCQGKTKPRTCQAGDALWHL
jgi:hypothetical protein